MTNPNFPLTPNPESRDINEWFPLFPQPVENDDPGVQIVALRTNALDVHWDDPLASQAIPVRVIADILLPSASKIYPLMMEEFPLDRDLGEYRVDQHDFTLAGRRTKYELVRSKFNTEYTRRLHTPSEPLYQLAIRLNSEDRGVEDFTEQEPRVWGAPTPTEAVFKPSTLRYLSETRFRIYAPAYGVVREAQAVAYKRGIHWDAFYALDTGPLPSSREYDIPAGHQIAFTPQHLHEWYGVFLAPGVMSIPFPYR